MVGARGRRVLRERDKVSWYSRGLTLVSQPKDIGAWLDQLGETRLKILAAYPASEERKEALHLLARRESCDPAACPVQQTLDRLLEAKAKEVL